VKSICLLYLDGLLIYFRNQTLDDPTAFCVKGNLIADRKVRSNFFLHRTLTSFDLCDDSIESFLVSGTDCLQSCLVQLFHHVVLFI